MHAYSFKPDEQRVGEQRDGERKKSGVVQVLLEQTQLAMHPTPEHDNIYTQSCLHQRETS